MQNAERLSYTQCAVCYFLPLRRFHHCLLCFLLPFVPLCSPLKWMCGRRAPSGGFFVNPLSVIISVSLTLRVWKTDTVWSLADCARLEWKAFRGLRICAVLR